MPIGRIQLKHGLESSADFNTMLQAEAYYATDTERLMIANGDGTGLILPSKNEIDTKIGDLTSLTTTEKGSIVGAVNEIDNNLNLVQSDLSDLIVQEFSVGNYRTSNSSGAAGSLIKSNGIAMFSGYLFVTSGLPAGASKVVLNLPIELRPKVGIYFPITIYSTTTTGGLAGFGIVGTNGDVMLYNKTTSAGGDAVAMSFNYKT